MAELQHVALVTGAGRNIGRAVVLELARRGYRVVVNGRTDQNAVDAVAEEARALGVDAIAVLADVGDSKAVTKLANTALNAFDKVDVVVNNAAIRPEKPFLALENEDWHRVLATDLHSAFYTCRAFLPKMVAQGWGRIINLTGMNAMHGYNGRCPVSVAKHGLWGLTKSLAKEFGPEGVTVNAISPGPIRSAHRDPSMTHHIESQLSRIPLGRLGEPEDIAALCGFLASEEGGFISGQMIASNGAAQT